MRLNVDAAKLGLHIRDLIGRRELPVVGALYSVALVDDGEDWAPVYSKLFFADAPLTVRPKREYASVVFDERWLSVDEALKVASGITTTSGTEFSPPRADNLGVHVSADRLGDGGSNNEPVSGWPEWTFEVSITPSRGLQNLQDPFVAHGQPPFRSQHEAVQDWLWSSMRRDSPFRQSATSMIIVPDYRGRVASIEWADDRLNVLVETRASMGALTVQVAAVVGTARVSLPERTASEIVSWSLPERTKSVQVFLVHRDGSCLGILERHQRGRELGAVRSLDEQAQADIAAGEGENVEFKPFIDVGHAKEHEVLRTVVAFANTSGGRIYMGVTDDAELQGEHALRKAAAADLEQARAIVQKHIEKLIRDKTKPVAQFAPSWAVVHGEPVLVISVERARGDPVATHDNDIFVRKGSTNRRPEPATELRALYFRNFRPRLGAIDDIDADDLDARELK